MTIAEILQYFDDHAGAISAAAAIAVPICGGAWVLYRHFFPGKKNGGGPGTEVAEIVKTLQEGHRQQLGDAAEREETLRGQVRQLTEAVQALADQRGKSGAPAGIDAALAHLAKGETDAAESVFYEVKERRKKAGAGALKEAAAAAARHIGALAYLHDTDKAMAAYREAVDLDPENADGWNRLGNLLFRTGDLNGAERAYGRFLSLGNLVDDDDEIIAIATSNLGNLYQTRGDLDRAEAMYRKSLALFREVGAAPKIERFESLLAELRNERR